MNNSNVLATWLGWPAEGIKGALPVIDRNHPHGVISKPSQEHIRQMIDRNHTHYLDTKLHRAVSHRNLMRGLVYGTIGGTICWVLIFALLWWLLR
jgi:hypothetical protein